MQWCGCSPISFDSVTGAIAGDIFKPPNWVRIPPFPPSLPVCAQQHLASPAHHCSCLWLPQGSGVRRVLELLLPHSNWALWGADLSQGEQQARAGSPSVPSFPPLSPPPCSLPAWEQALGNGSHPLPPTLSLGQV